MTRRQSAPAGEAADWRETHVLPTERYADMHVPARHIAVCESSILEVPICQARYDAMYRNCKPKRLRLPAKLSSMHDRGRRTALPRLVAMYAHTSVYRFDKTEILASRSLYKHEAH